MLTTYEEYTAGKGRCVRRSELEQQAAEQHINIQELINQANAQGITVVMWA